MILKVVQEYSIDLSQIVSAINNRYDLEYDLDEKLVLAAIEKGSKFYDTEMANDIRDCVVNYCKNYGFSNVLDYKFADFATNF